MKRVDKMNKKMTVLFQVLGLGIVMIAGSAMAAPQKESGKIGEILFKIHDVVPEKNADGKVLYCNIGATFFNRTNIDISNASLTLKWDDEVIGDAIDQEERADKEQRRVNPNAVRPRYSTSSFSGKTISASLKLPPLKMGQQVSLKTKVDTDRCFLLLNDMNINVNNCGTAGLDDKVARQGCRNLFSYVSPKMPEYYMDFKTVSHDEQMALEDAAVDGVRKELNAIFDEAIASIRSITSDEGLGVETEEAN